MSRWTPLLSHLKPISIYSTICVELSSRTEHDFIIQNTLYMPFLWSYFLLLWVIWIQIKLLNCVISNKCRNIFMIIPKYAGAHINKLYQILLGLVLKTETKTWRNLKKFDVIENNEIALPLSLPLQSSTVAIRRHTSLDTSLVTLRSLWEYFEAQQRSRKWFGEFRLNRKVIEASPLNEGICEKFADRRACLAGIHTHTH